MMSARLAILLSLWLTIAGAYRLNVPRLLLPYHPTIPVTFELEVASPIGGCFYWRSNRPDVVSVNPLGNVECSDRAEVTSTAKVSGLHSAVIFAEDSNGGTTLSCGVTVDDVASIAIEHTTKILYVDAAPAPITAIAYNSEGDKFSTLGQIPFEWELSTDGGDSRPLRIVPFEQSKYRAPKEIQALEIAKKKGYVILLEGLATGSSMIQAKFLDQHFSKVEPHSLDLVVVANLLLIPSYDLYVPVNSNINFGVWIVKEQSTEEVSMPSPAYYLQLDKSDICSLDSTTSSVTAIKKGTSELSLLTHNVDMKSSKSGAVRPPSTTIHVVDPESLQFAISGNNWLIETGRIYKIHVNLMDPQGNHMFIADNSRFETFLSVDYFDIHFNTKNGTYFEVTAKKSGKTSIRSKFRSIILNGGIEYAIDRRVTGEQLVEVVDPIQIIPSTVAFPYLPRIKIDYRLKALGGSGVFSWSSGDGSICGIDESSGMLRSGDIGTTQITATDRRNKKHQATAEVSVLDVISLGFGKTRVEAEEGQQLTLNLQLFGVDKSGQHIPLTDCRSVPFSVEVQDSRVFQHNAKVESSLPKEGSGCGTVTLRAIQSGDTKVTVRYDKYRAVIDVSAYPPLKASVVDDVVLAVGSRYTIKIEGGPRPWLLDSSRYFTTGLSSEVHTTVSIADQSVAVSCGNEEGISRVVVRVGNEPTPSNELPSTSQLSIPLCCVVPTRLSLATSQSAKTGGKFPLCPASARSIFVSSPSLLSLTAFGSCSGSEERILDSISGLKVNWNVDEKKLLVVKEDKDNKEQSRISATATPQGKPGAVRISVESSSTSAGKLRKPLKTTLDLKLVSRAVPSPSNVVLWNEPSAIGIVRLEGGSGHFFILEKREEYDASLADSKISIVPRRLGKTTLRLVDICIDDSIMEIPVKITDIHTLRIRAPKHLEVEKHSEVSVDVVDESGETFSSDFVTLMQLQLTSDSKHGELVEIEPTRFRLHGRTVGTVTFSASARSSSGTVLRSRPHSVQIFSPILLFPKQITLIPESTFQLEVVGGPQPTPPISFSLNNSKIVNVESNALITSQNIGYTLITGTVEDGDGRSSKDSVTVKVVSLTGVRISVSTQRTETGGKIWARLQGLDGDETPFAFGGAVYPFKVTWSVSDSSVLSVVSPLGTAYSEYEQNKFGIWLDAKSHGKAVISVNVELHKKAKQHFKGSSQSFSSHVHINVDDVLSLSNPSLTLDNVRIAPDSELKLQSNWPSSYVSWSVSPDSRSLLSISSTGILRSFGVEGPASLLLKRETDGVNRTRIVPVQVSRARSLSVSVSPSLSSPSTLSALPVGLSLTLHVQFRDHFGVLLHAAPNSINYRPHRFDLTDIVATDFNRSLTITMKTAGETVLKIWDTQDESLSTFIRLNARDQLLPVVDRHIVVSDVICFNSPVEGAAHWSVSNDKLQLVSGSIGVARHNGDVHVSVETEDGQKMHSTLSISSPSHISFGSRPSLISNIGGSRFVFPVKIVHQQNETYSGSCLGCSPTSLSSLDGLSAPFHCHISFGSSQTVPASHIFNAKPVFCAQEASYACVVEQQIAGSVQLSINDYKLTDLSVTAIWNNERLNLQTSTKVPFHMAFEVLTQQIDLSNYEQDSSVIGIRSPSYSLHSIRGRGCGDVITVSETKPSYPQGTANKHFLIKLNVKAAMLWQDREHKCDVTIENEKTGQIETVPVNIRLVGQAAKHVYDAIDSKGFIDFVLIFLQHYSYLLPPMMTICLISIALLAAYSYMNRSQSKSGTALHNSTGIFASDAPSPAVSVQSSPGNARTSPSPGYHWRNSPPQYHSTPVDANATFSSAAGSPGSRGSPQLWTTSDVRRRM